MLPFDPSIPPIPSNPPIPGNSPPMLPMPTANTAAYPHHATVVFVVVAQPRTPLILRRQVFIRTGEGTDANDREQNRERERERRRYRDRETEGEGVCMRVYVGV